MFLGRKETSPRGEEETVGGKEGGGGEAGPSWRRGWNPLQASGHSCLFFLKNNRFEVFCVGFWVLVFFFA